MLDVADPLSKKYQLLNREGNKLKIPKRVERMSRLTEPRRLFRTTERR